MQASLDIATLKNMSLFESHLAYYEILLYCNHTHTGIHRDCYPPTYPIAANAIVVLHTTPASASTILCATRSAEAAITALH